MCADDDTARSALARLSLPDAGGAGALSRRRFLQLVGAGVGASTALGAIEGLGPLDWLETAEAAAPGDGILLLVGLFGGSDGLDIVVPYADSQYTSRRGSLARTDADVLDIDGSVGLHPSLPFLHSLYGRGQVAVVEGVGHAAEDLSHFSMMATWMSGAASGPPSSGWIGRWMDGLAGTNLLRAVTVGQSVPLHMQGLTRRGVSVPHWGIGFGGDTDAHSLRMYEAYRDAAAPAGRGSLHDSVSTAWQQVVDIGRDVSPVFERALPQGDLARKMVVAARMINADMGVRVVDLSHDGFDTHAQQATGMADLLGDLDAGLRSFYATLDDRFHGRVTVMTYSEFGRTPWANDSGGTDHGTANSLFVIGRGVKGGLYGQRPSLAGLDRWERMQSHVDFRSLYGSVIDGWMGGGSSTVLGASYPDLGLFASAPSAPTGSAPALTSGGVVQVVPARLYDSRTDPRRLPLGAGASAQVRVTGRAGVPSTGVAAVMLQVASVAATDPTKFSARPTGSDPLSAVHLSVAGSARHDGLVVVAPGAAGRVEITNDAGEAHCVVDVVGYLPRSGGARMVALRPGRLYDSRSSGGPLGSGSPVAVAARGRQGVRSTATSTMVVVTVIDASSAGRVVAWGGGSRPAVAATMTFGSGGRTSRTLAVPLDADGRLRLEVVEGSAHVVVDAVASVQAGSGGVVTPVRNRALFDGALTAGSARRVVVADRLGVPVSGAAGALVQVTARRAPTGGGVTLWASGTARPSAPQVSLRAGEATSCLVPCVLGSDGSIQVQSSVGTHVRLDIVAWLSA
ncbi:MAG: hypothetical protein RLZ04_1136 [Actinomycetota bacterium]